MAASKDGAIKPIKLSTEATGSNEFLDSIWGDCSELVTFDDSEDDSEGEGTIRRKSKAVVRSTAGEEDSASAAPSSASHALKRHRVRNGGGDDRVLKKSRGASGDARQYRKLLFDATEMLNSYFGNGLGKISRLYFSKLATAAAAAIGEDTMEALLECDGGTDLCTRISSFTTAASQLRPLINAVDPETDEDCPHPLCEMDERRKAVGPKAVGSKGASKAVGSKAVGSKAVGSKARTNERTNGRTNGRTDERADERTNGRTNDRANERTNGRTKERKDGRTNERTDGRTNDWTEQTNGRTNERVNERKNTNGRTGGRTNGKTNERTNGRTNERKQGDKRTVCHLDCFRL